MPELGAIHWIAFLMASSFTLLVLLLVAGRRGRLESRLEELSGRPASLTDIESVSQLARSTLPKVGAPLMPKDEEERTRLQGRMLHAGYYTRQALVLYLGVKMLLMVGPVLVGVGAGLTGFLPLLHGLVLGAALGTVGMIAPSFWLDYCKRQRQTLFRRALPDALDVLVICLEGGLSLPGAFRRVATELRTAHPLLASELNIVQREIQMGRSTGQALRQFGERADLEEIRTLGSVITQAERFGASLVKALRVHAETLREKRLHYAEEMAQKAAIKILFPTLIFIFPAIFVILLGPGVIRVLEMFSHMR
jgi:tight adherence protein C